MCVCEREYPYSLDKSLIMKGTALGILVALRRGLVKKKQNRRLEKETKGHVLTLIRHGLSWSLRYNAVTMQ